MRIITFVSLFAIVVSGSVSLDAQRHALRHNTSAPAAAARTGLMFVPLSPCRIADTRLADGPFGGPVLSGPGHRDFVLPNSACGLPSNAAAYSLNVTAVPVAGGLGYLSIWPSGQAQPTVSTLNSDSRIRANAAIVPAGANGAISVFVSDSSHVILDINGYFVPEGSGSGLEFYPLTPCRVMDTRGPAAPLAGPFLAGGVPRTVPVRASACQIPSGAQAYSLNMTAVPHQGLAFLATWPTGQAQPLVSTLNAGTGTVTANAAIVPAGSGGSIDVYAANDSDLVIDINGYFAPYGSGGLELYALAPCRVLDTRLAAGIPVNGNMAANVVASSCGVPSSAQAMVLNATVVPAPNLSFLTLWPDGTARPLVSTLNAPDGAVTANMALVPTSDGAVDLFSTQATQVILDIASYFAPGSTQPSAGVAASPAVITAGSSATLAWTSANTSSCTAGGSWNGAVALAGSQSVTLSAAGVYKYSLTCGGSSGTVTSSGTLTVRAPNTPLAVSVLGNQLLDANGNAIQLRGVNVSALESTAVQGWAVEPNGGYNVWGDAGLGEEPPWQRIHDTWYSNVVRLPLNEASWLGYTCTNANGSTENPDPGHNYKARVQQSVAAANAAGMYVILDLHWSAPRALVNGVMADVCPTAQNSMADADHSLAFWTSVATAFQGNPSVMFELFNEPIFYWLLNGADQWQVLQSGGTVTKYVTDSGTFTANWTAAGLQQLMTTVRNTGARNVVLVSGLNWNADLSQLATHLPNDPAGQMAVAWHPYPGSNPAQPSNGVAEYTYAQQLAASFPFLLTEFGDHSAAGTVGAPFASILLPWADSNGISYVGWTWDPWGQPDDDLIKDASGTPSDGYGQYVQTHLACRASGTAVCP